MLSESESQEFVMRRNDSSNETKLEGAWRWLRDTVLAFVILLRILLAPPTRKLNFFLFQKTFSWTFNYQRFPSEIKRNRRAANGRNKKSFVQSAKWVRRSPNESKVDASSHRERRTSKINFIEAVGRSWKRSLKSVNWEGSRGIHDLCLGQLSRPRLNLQLFFCIPPCPPAHLIRPGNRRVINSH